MPRSFLFGCIATLTISASAFAHDYKVGDIRVDHPYARPTVAAQTAGGVYLSIENRGKTSDQLIAASSPVSKSAELHTMSMEGNVMKMREVPHIEIKPSEKIAMRPGHGYHIMLIGLKQPLKAGDSLPLTLRFKNAGTVETKISVENKQAESSAMPSLPHSSH
ncbi:MAG: copper chaperone PCu(A)C [Burkholderiaceae bacterium]